MYYLEYCENCTIWLLSLNFTYNVVLVLFSSLWCYVPYAPRYIISNSINLSRSLLCDKAITLDLKSGWTLLADQHSRVIVYHVFAIRKPSTLLTFSYPTPPPPPPPLPMDKCVSRNMIFWGKHTLYGEKLLNKKLLLMFCWRSHNRQNIK